MGGWAGNGRTRPDGHDGTDPSIEYVRSADRYYVGTERISWSSPRVCIHSSPSIYILQCGVFCLYWKLDQELDTPA